VLQDALQAESRRTLDALQRLPAALAAALPVTDVQLLPGTPAKPQQPQLGQLNPADQSWLQGVLEDALSQAAERVLASQVCAQLQQSFSACFRLCGACSCLFAERLVHN
jgi:hypothetical protein